MGTVELTGFVMMHIIAEGQALAAAAHKLFTMPALVLNRSSRVIPVGRVKWRKEVNIVGTNFPACYVTAQKYVQWNLS